MNRYIIGDLHGYFDRFVSLLQDSELIDQERHWTGGDSELYLIGDFFDRGPDGIGCVELAMTLQQQASASGGKLTAILGNHEIMFLANARFGDPDTYAGIQLREQWEHWGGMESDLEQATEAQLDWLARLPAMVSLGDSLLAHADATLYLEMGRTVDEVNESFWQLTLHETDHRRWLQVLRDFGEHMAFCSPTQVGKQRAEGFLDLFAHRRLVHGHTPIPYARRTHANRVKSAWTYAGGRCINVDGGIYMGGPGFVYQLTN